MLHIYSLDRSAQCWSFPGVTSCCQPPLQLSVSQCPLVPQTLSSKYLSFIEFLNMLTPSFPLGLWQWCSFSLEPPFYTVSLAFFFSPLYMPSPAGRKPTPTPFCFLSKHIFFCNSSEHFKFITIYLLTDLVSFSLTSR